MPGATIEAAFLFFIFRQSTAQCQGFGVDINAHAVLGQQRPQSSERPPRTATDVQSCGDIRISAELSKSFDFTFLLATFANKKVDILYAAES